MDYTSSWHNPLSVMYLEVNAEVVSEKQSKFDSLKEHKIVSLCATFCSASLENSVTKRGEFFVHRERRLHGYWVPIGNNADRFTLQCMGVT